MAELSAPIANDEPTLSAALPRWTALLGVGIVNGLFLVLIAAGQLTAYELLAVFWLELGVIGLATLARLAIAILIGKPFDSRYAESSRPATLLIGVISGGFFVAKFGAVMLGFGVLLLILPTDDLWRDMTTSDLGPWVEASLWVLLASHAYEFVVNYLARRGYRDVRVLSLLLYPYVRGIWIVGAIGIALVATANSALETRPVLFAMSVLAVKALFDAICALRMSR